MFGALGIGADDVTRIFVDFAEGAEMLASGQVDAQFQCPIPNQVMITAGWPNDVAILLRTIRVPTSEAEPGPFATST